MIQKHCFDCGTLLIEKELEGEGVVPYCPKCEQYRFPMYNVAVSMIVINEQTGEILLWVSAAQSHVSSHCSNILQYLSVCSTKQVWRAPLKTSHRLLGMFS